MEDKEFQRKVDGIAKMVERYTGVKANPPTREELDELRRKMQNSSSGAARERGKQQIERHGGASYAYTIAKQPEGAAKQIADGLSARGIEAIVIDAPLETNQNGVTVERGDAVTGPDGRVYIYNGTALNQTVFWRMKAFSSRAKE